MGQIETMLRHSDTQTTPYTPEPKIRFYGQSVSTSIVTKPDGVSIAHFVCSKEATQAFYLGLKGSSN